MKPSYYSTLMLKTSAFFLIWLLLSESLYGLHLGIGIVVAFGVAWLNTERTSTRATARDSSFSAEALGNRRTSSGRGFLRNPQNEPIGFEPRRFWAKRGC